ALGRHGLSYYSGGIIRQSGASGPTKSLEGMLRSKDLIGVETEFARAIGNIESDPPASLTAACAIIESLCKFYIEDAGLEMPKDQTVKPLWNTVRVHLGMTPETIADQDLLKIITGLSSIVDGLGAFRSHVGSAHGHGFERYDLKPRHVRLAVHAAHTLTTFILETWDEQGKKAAKPK
ncbi:MAG: abortive infection family protein, partial [Desulfovibrionaceae bacterium]